MPTALVGRERELSDVTVLLRDHRLVTLTGAGGVGKTRLAKAVAPPDGVCVVELVGVKDPALVGQAVLDALDLHDEGGAGPVAVISEWLGDEALLLVLDNCEHLVDAAAELVDGLLRRCPGLTVLATSRESLRVGGERIFPVPALDLRGSAVELFARRASEATTDFAVTDDNRAVVEQVTRQLDGLPLAIELAAARLRTLTLPELADRLSDRFSLLTDRRRDVQPHHRTIRMCVEWSYDQCSDDERLLWRRASVFVESFDLAAAEAVCGFGDVGTADVIDLVAALIDKSVLVRVDPREEDDDGVARYLLLETLREYGVEQLSAAGELDDLVARHRRYFTDLVLDVRARVNAGVLGQWTRLDRDLPNVRRAIDPPLTAWSDLPPESTAAIIAMDVYWEWRGLSAEGLAHLRRAAAVVTEPTFEVLDAMRVGALLARMHGADEVAHELLTRQKVLARGTDDPLTRAVALQSHGEELMLARRAAEAVPRLTEAVALYAEHGDRRRLVWAYFQLVEAHVGAGDLESAARVHAEGRPVAHGLGVHNATYWEVGLVPVLLARGQVAEATEVVLTAIRTHANARYTSSITYFLEILALVVGAGGRLEVAATVLGAARHRIADLGRRPDFEATYPEEFEELERKARELLGDAGFERALAAGARLTDEDVDALVRGTQRSAAPELSARELDVALLVAEGLTNRLIAERLFITPRTVRGHVENILAKLGVESRVQIATWVSAREGAD